MKEENMKEKANKEIKEALEVYFANNGALANYEQGDHFENEPWYKDGIKVVKGKIAEYYKGKYDGEKYKIFSKCLAEYKKIDPGVYIKYEDSSANDGIYIYLKFPINKDEKELTLSLEIGEDNRRYTKNDSNFEKNNSKLRTKYNLLLKQLEDNLKAVGKFKLLNESRFKIKITETEFDNILSFIEPFEPIYDKIVEDIKEYNPESEIWGQNWEQYQKDTFGDTYVEPTEKEKNTTKNKNNKNKNNKEADNTTEDNSSESKETDNTTKGHSNKNSTIKGYNRIYYGIPGCGKSSFIKRKYNLTPDNYIRTTFYPDYTNSDFVGQIIPKLDKKNNITYDIEAGPFTIALLKALKNQKQAYYLVIEEINRGNASAIFGDIFQILDRKDGKSEYEIDNYLIRDYLNKELKLDKPIEKISLPSNLYILATMNTTDQNVYTLDTAFKRRWEMRYISNEFNDNEDYDKKLRNMYIPASNVKWEDFLNKINNAILGNSFGFNSEDKQLGKYFVGMQDLTEKENDNDVEKLVSFGEKVLMYIWEDVAKTNRNSWFTKDYKTFEALLKDFKNIEIGLKVFNIDFGGNNNEQTDADSDK